MSESRVMAAVQVAQSQTPKTKQPFQVMREALFFERSAYSAVAKSTSPLKHGALVLLLTFAIVVGARLAGLALGLHRAGDVYDLFCYNHRTVNLMLALEKLRNFYDRHHISNGQVARGTCADGRRTQS